MIFFGIGFLFLGILLLSSISFTYPWASSIGFFLGIVMTCSGILMETGFYGSSSLSGKLSSIIITTSFALFASSFVTITYRVVIGERLVPIIFHGSIQGWTVRPITILPYGWLALPLFDVGIVLFATGVILRIISEYF